MSKVLIAAPIGDGKEYSINEWFEWVVNNDYEDVEVALCVNGKSQEAIEKKMRLLKEVELTHKNGKKIHLNLLKINYRESYSLFERVSYSREELRLFALENGFSHLFFLDTDTIPATSGALKKLLSRELDFVSGVYFYKGSKQPVLIDEVLRTNVRLEKLKEYYERDEPFRIWGCGYGVLLLSKPLLEQCVFDWDVHKDNWGEDFAHSEMVEKAGFARWCDPTIVCRHYRSKDFTDTQEGAACEKEHED
jgi:hypothetical protein